MYTWYYSEYLNLANYTCTIKLYTFHTYPFTALFKYPQFTSLPIVVNPTQAVLCTCYQVLGKV